MVAKSFTPAASVSKVAQRCGVNAARRAGRGDGRHNRGGALAWPAAAVGLSLAGK
jgi:transposase-like protein